MNKESMVKRIDRIMNGLSETSQKMDRGEFKTEVDRTWVELYNLIDDIESGE